MQQLKILYTEFSSGVHKYTIYISNNPLNVSVSWIWKNDRKIERGMAFQGKKPVGSKISFYNANEIGNRIVK
jgi:hypothetical protein